MSFIFALIISCPMLITYLIQMVSIALMVTLFIANGVKTARMLSRHKDYWYDFERVNVLTSEAERRRVKKIDRSNLIYAVSLLLLNIIARILFKDMVLF